MSLLSVLARLAMGAVGGNAAVVAGPDEAPARPQAKPRRRPAKEPEKRLAGRDPDRLELKYWIPEARVPDLLAFVETYLVHDPNGANGQVNTSLYFETPDLAFFRAHQESSPDRRKLRIRAYGDPPAGIAFFETKRKVKAATVKTRAAVPLADVPALLDGTWESLPSMKDSARRHLEDFLFMRTLLHAEPIVLVRAHRVALASADPLEDIRVTLDSKVCFQPARGASFDADPDGWIPIDGEVQHGRHGPHTLLELKFPRIAPAWMRTLTDGMGVPRIAYSKYMSAVRLLLAEQELDGSLLDRRPAGVAR